jgi:hypothetical protein
MPSFSILRQVKDFIQPDVSLYLEGVNYLARIISRGKSEAQIPNSGQEYHSAAGYIDILKSAGFSKMHIYWIWPDLKNINKFIPINDFAPLAYVLNRNKRGKLARAKGLITRLAVQSGLIMHLVPYYCIVAKRGTP